MSKVKIISGWSNPGGSTIHHINLTNLLNDNGIDCTFYGPQKYHLDKCKSGTMDELKIHPDEILISHFISLNHDVRCKQHIFSCHEKEMWDLKKQGAAQYDIIHFVSNLQKEWHGVNHPSVVIPPIVNKVNWTNPQNGVAGVIGSIDPNKQTHASIHRALKDGFSQIKLFGDITDLMYFNEMVGPVMNSKASIILAGHEADSEAMYRQLSAVYHSSKSETYGLVEAECKASGIPFNGSSNGQPILDKTEILEKWIKTLKL